MYQILKKNLEKIGYFGFGISILIFFLLVSVVFKNSSKLPGSQNIYIEGENWNTIKEYLLTKIKCIFVNKLFRSNERKIVSLIS